MQEIHSVISSIDDINDKSLYGSYVPERNDCIVVDDDLILAYKINHLKQDLTNVLSSSY